MEIPINQVIKADQLKWRSFRIEFNLRFFLLFVLFVFCSSFVTAQPVLSSDSAVRSAGDFEKISRVPVPERPFLFLNREEIAASQARTEKEEWAKKLKENYIRIAESWVARDYNFIKGIIPGKGSIYIYGLGKDLDPVLQKKMKWRGWKDPRHVEADNGDIYPNAAHQDDGKRWTDPKRRTEYFFIALANGMTIKQLETIDLPDLINAYVLTGNETYAERALWLLDAIATIYPRANEGPIDYPNLAPGKPDGGRLERPYYQAARALMNYAYFTEVLSMSVHSKKASPSNSGYTILKNIELNLLMNGADYCFRMTKDFKFTVTPLLTKPLEVLQVESQPLRVLVNSSYEQTKHLAGSIIRLNKPELVRPFVLRVNKSEAAGKNSWLTIDASSNIHAVGVVQSYDPKTHSIITDSPFPHTRPYTYTYSEKTGFGLPAEKNIQYDYNGGYNGFWLVGN